MSTKNVIGKIKAIPLPGITVSGLNPRIVKPDDPTITSLAESMGASGQLAPVIVRPLSDPDTYELLAGARRFAAAQKLGWVALTAEIREVDDQQALVIITTENLQREDLTPFEEAEQLQLLLERFANDPKAVAAQLGRPDTWVARRAQLLKLSPCWKEAIKADKLNATWTAALLELIARYDQAIQDDLFNNFKRYHQFAHFDSVKELEGELAGLMHTLRKAPFAVSDETLIPEIGACTACPKRSSCQPLLFESEGVNEDQIKQNDRCLDTGCWDKKIEANLDRKIEQYKDKYPNLAQIRTSGYPSGDDEAGSLYPYEYDNAKRSDPAALPAITIDGNTPGTLRWIRPKKGAGKKVKITKTKKPVDQKTTGEIKADIENKMEHLNMRRAAHVVGQVRGLFDANCFKNMYPKKTPPVTDDGKTAIPRLITLCKAHSFHEINEQHFYILRDMFSLAIVFGTETKADGHDKESWRHFAALIDHDLGDNELVLELWQKMAPVFRHRIQVYNGREALDRLPEVRELCKLLDIDYAELEKKAEAEIPMSKALQSLLAAKAEKKRPGKVATDKEKTDGIDNSLWNSECDEALRHSFSFDGSKKRWADMRKRGLTDLELRKSIFEEYGDEGAKTSAGLIVYHKKIGRSLLFEIRLKSGKIIRLKGAEFLAKVREVMAIPYPGDSKAENKPKKKAAKQSAKSEIADKSVPIKLKPTSRKLIDIAKELDEILANVSEGQRSAFVTGRKIKVVYDRLDASDFELLSANEAEKYLAWLKTGNVGDYRYSDMP